MLLVLLGLFGGCKKEPGEVTFNVKSESNFIVEGSGSILSLLEVVTPGVSTNWEGDFANHNTNKEQLRDMRLRNLVLNITAPAGETFEFLENIHIYIEADGLQETEIAYRDNIPTNIGQTLELQTKDVDISPYAKKDAFKLRIKAKQRSVNPDDVHIRANMTFQVTANVLD
ncbi:MAG: hypothetical protein ACXWEY_04855 [Bacteroidia bacterium]